ncbi:MAG TPA: hypothetical protein DCO83_15675 [Mucilaginibacter sp.]|jgi:hypothetical protein|nr:hypothetical protein [Mucilaginibacter sp.]
MKNTAYLILLFTALLIGLYSCKNNDEVFPNVKYTYITVINAGADTLNFYLNGTRQNNASSIFPAGALELQIVPAGLQNYAFKKTGQSVVLFGLPLNLTFNTLNSVYITGESANSVFKTVDTIPQLNTAQTDTLAVRFVNAAPDAGNLNVFVGDTVKFNSAAFKSSSVFYLTGRGKKKVTVYLAGAAIPIIDTAIIFQPAVSYTLFAKGLLNGKGNAAFGLGLLINQIP